MKIQGRSILVTGANGGIGSEVCRGLQEQGANLILVGSDRDALEKLNRSLGGRHQMVVADLTSETDRQALLDVGVKQKVSGVINLAGVLNFNEFIEQSPALIERTIGVNLLAPMLLCQTLLPELLKREEGFILNVGSVFGSIGHPGFVAYCSSKAGLKRFSEALARELADTRIKVLYMAPRATRTALNSERVNALNQALGNKSDSPALVAARIIKQIEQESAQVVLGWPEKLFVLINAVLPGLVRSALVKQLDVIKRHARA